MSLTRITNVRPWGGATADVVLDGGYITEIVASGPVGAATAIADDSTIDGGGGILIPSFSDVHVHLDSTRMGLPFRPNTSGVTLWDHIMNDRENWRSAEKSVSERATYTLGRMIAQGATRVRSHAQVDADSGLDKLEGVLAARDAHRDRVDVEIVAFPQVGIHLEDGVPDLLDAALRGGADLIGGLDPCVIDRDPRRHLDTVFDLAERHGVGIDIHLHEGGTLGLFSLDMIIERTRALGMQGKVTVSHAFSLASGLPGVSSAIEKLADLDIAVTTIAPKGSLTTPLDLPLSEMLDAGVRVGLGMDGQRDYWSPWGNGDMLERAWMLAFTQGYSTDEAIETALAVATWGGANVIDGGLRRIGGGAHPGIAVGDPAEFVILTGETPTSAVMDRLPERTVVHRGRVIARDGELR